LWTKHVVFDADKTEHADRQSKCSEEDEEEEEPVASLDIVGW
jgi:hypothetical protein